MLFRSRLESLHGRLIKLSLEAHFPVGDASLLYYTNHMCMYPEVACATVVDGKGRGRVSERKGRVLLAALPPNSRENA